MGGTQPCAFVQVVLRCFCTHSLLLRHEGCLLPLTSVLFTSHPLQVALRWFCSRSLLRHEGITKELIDRIPGKQTDRKTPLGKLILRRTQKALYVQARTPADAAGSG